MGSDHSGRTGDEALLETLGTDPASPFEVDPCGVGSQDVLWTSSGDIGVLLRSLRSMTNQGALQPWELTFPVTLQVRDGRITLFVGGHYRS